MFDQILRDFAPVTDLLTAFVQIFDIDYTVALGADFEANLDEMKITYAIAMAEKSGLAFRDNFIKRFPVCADFDLFTLSLMHELGHLETEWDMIDDTDMRNTISDNDSYFNLHNEKIATDWAGDYLTENHDDMKKWESQVLNLIKEALDKYPNE